MTTMRERDLREDEMEFLGDAVATPRKPGVCGCGVPADPSQERPGADEWVVGALMQMGLVEYSEGVCGLHGEYYRLDATPRGREVYRGLFPEGVADEDFAMVARKP